MSSQTHLNFFGDFLLHLSPNSVFLSVWRSSLVFFFFLNPFPTSHGRTLYVICSNVSKQWQNKSSAANRIWNCEDNCLCYESEIVISFHKLCILVWKLLSTSVFVPFTIYHNTLFWYYLGGLGADIVNAVFTTHMTFCINIFSANIYASYFLAMISHSDAGIICFD